ncbi:MAG: hypothetical protein QXX08_06875 [Candidatus Bathyarchaeia archaeon]
MTENSKNLLKLLASISFEHRRKICLNVLPEYKKSKPPEGTYSIKDVLIFQPDPILTEAIKGHEKAVWKHEFDHFLHLKLSFTGFILKELDLMAKRNLLTYLLYPEIETHGFVGDWIEKFVTIRDGLFYDVSGVIEGSAIMLSFEEEFSDFEKNDAFYEEKEQLLREECSLSLSSYRITNEIRKNLGRDFVFHAIQIALNNADYPKKSHFEIFQQIAEISPKVPSSLKSERNTQELIEYVLKELHLSVHPYKDSGRIIQERCDILQNYENSYFQGFISLYFLECLRLWRRQVYTLRTLENVAHLKFDNNIKEEDKEKYKLGLPAYTFIYESPEKISSIIVDPLFKCPIYAFYYNFDNFMDSLLSKFRIDYAKSLVNINDFRNNLARFLYDQKQIFKERFTEPNERTFLNIFPKLR